MDLPEDFEDYVKADLDKASNFSSALLSAAQKVQEALGGPESAEFKSWLRESVGEIPVLHPDLVEAMQKLDCPIATFNYDSIIERVTGRASRTWREAPDVQGALNGLTTDVVHLHGVWTDPKSVIFANTAYGQILADSAAQALQQAIASMRSLIFIGCGDGLQDPNIGKLFKWLNTTIPESPVKHYRLCLEGELDRYAAASPPGAPEPVAYGKEYRELAEFIRSLTPAREIAVISEGSQLLQRDLVNRARQESVLAKHMPHDSKLPLDRILVKPVVLPVSHEQFMEARRNEDAPQMHRSDIDSDLKEHEVIVLVADESSGLTSALQWLVCRGAELIGPTHPVLVDYKLFQGTAPLTRSIKLQLRSVNVQIADDEPIPDCFLAIDNVMPSDRPVFSRTLAELPFASARCTIIGCRAGAEARLLEALSEAGVTRPATRYLGKLNQKDIQEIAALVQPSSARRIAEKAVEILNREHLSRTPLTVCLLISVILQGEALLSTGSETALLDAYVSLLLGQGDPRDDSRFDFDAQDRISLLAALAEEFVRQDRGAIKESDAIAAFEQFFKDVRWKESASAVLHNLGRRHVLTVRNQSVSFAQTSFLHLFAAKRALVKSSFRDKLLERPHHYSQIIRHYAALSRSDELLLRRMMDLLVEHHPVAADIERGRSLSRLKTEELPSSDALTRMLEVFNDEADDGTTSGQESAEHDGMESQDDPLDDMEDFDHVPFPTSQIEEAPPLVRIFSTLGLVSVVLRDSEQVLDHQLKRDLLSLTLQFWGRLIDALEADALFKSAMVTVADAVVEDEWNFSEREREKFIKHFVELAPVLLPLGAIRGTLTSRKLFLSLEDCFQQEEFNSDAGAAVMGALLGWDMGEEGWAANLLQLRDHHGDVRAVTEVVRSIALYTYYHTRPSVDDEADLLEFLADQFSRFRAGGQNTSVDLKDYKARQRQRLKANRLRLLARANSGGDQAVADLGA